jgi:putative radical SAM enzyme (TIGR03279 family)
MVQDVSEGSLAAYLELEPGDRIVAVNGRTLRDELDFRFLTSEEDLTILIRKRNGEEQAFEVDKDPDEPFGVTFVQPIFDRIKECANNCKFCFVRQIPKEMRRTLHVRDDDYRMSFLYGNFISLTNLTEEDWQRLEEQRLSPLRVSVHTTDPALRQELMRNPKAADVMEHLRRLSGMGIRLHAQIVLLKGINDGENLVRTLRDLESLGPNMVSVGVVPAVYTKYRENPPSPPIDPAWAGKPWTS